jgi:hypothetical protein
MSASTVRLEPPATGVNVSEHALHVVLACGREITVPLAWFPVYMEPPPPGGVLSPVLARDVVLPHARLKSRSL